VTEEDEDEDGRGVFRRLERGLGHQCSILKPSYEFHFEGLSNFSPSLASLVQIQDINPRV
jgi:hypothetical protein